MRNLRPEGGEARSPDHAHGDGSPALAMLVERLRRADYRFVTVTPATHQRVLARRAGRPAEDLRDIFGWNLPFGEAMLDAHLFARLRADGQVVEDADGLWRSAVRVSSLDDTLFVHSAFPTDAQDAVFFGPDSYRFAALIDRELPPARHRPLRIVDIGTGAGVGAVVAAKRRPDAEVIGTDINPKALSFAALNAQAAGVTLGLRHAKGLDGIDGPIDVALANPPYIMDEGDRDYRDGGGLLGGAVALQMAEEAVARLSPGGRLILYTGSAIVGGADPLCARLHELAIASGCELRCLELDPDIFGEELERPAYADVERIALIAAILTRPGARA